MATDRLGSLLIITEDSGAEGHATIVAVVKRMLQLIRATALRTIATKLGRKDGFVLFHIDGDQTWTERRSSENVELFRKRVIEPVRMILMRSDSTARDAEARILRLLPVVPFYSIEAWLYQHTEVAIRLCRDRYQGRDVARFEAWRQDRAALDDVTKPKDEVCIKSSHNLECAGRGYPAQAVFEAGRSYMECVLRLLACSELWALLDATAGREKDETLE